MEKGEVSTVVVDILLILELASLVTFRKMFELIWSGKGEFLHFGSGFLAFDKEIISNMILESPCPTTPK